MAALTDPARPGCQSDLNPRAIDKQPDWLRVFSHETAVQAWDEFLEFVPKKWGTESISSFETAGSILTLARLDAFFDTVVLYL